LAGETALTWPIGRAAGAVGRRVAPTRFAGAPTGFRTAVGRAITPRREPTGIVGQMWADRGVGPLPSNEEIIGFRYKPDWFRSVSEKAGKIPGLNKVVRTIFGPSAAPEDLARVSMAIPDDVSNVLMNYRTIYKMRRDAIGDPIKVFNIDEKGIARAIKPLELPYEGLPKSNYIGDIVENAELYQKAGLLTDDQYRMAKLIMEEESYFDLLLWREGIRATPYTPGGAKFHRVVKGLEYELPEGIKGIAGAPRGGVKGRAGLLGRVHRTQAQGAAKGILYEPNPNKWIAERGLAVEQLVSQKRWTGFFEGIGQVPKERVAASVITEAALAKEAVTAARQMRGALSWAAKGARPRQPTLQMIKELFPEISLELEKVLGATLERQGILRGQHASLLAERNVISQLQRQAIPNIPRRQIISGLRAGRNLKLGNEEALGLLNRTIRNEVLPEGTIKAISSHHPEVAQALSSLKQYPREYSRILQGLQKVARGEVRKAERAGGITAATKRAAFEKAKRPSHRTLTAEEAERMMLGHEARVIEEATTRAMPSRIFPRPIADSLDKIYRDQAASWLRAASTVSGVGRMAVAGFDVSWPAIQGLAVLGRDPGAWAKATLNSYRYAMQPKEFFLWAAREDIKPVLDRMAYYGMDLQSFEYFEKLYALQKLGGKQVGRVLQQTYGRGEVAYTSASIRARHAYWVANEDRVLAKYGEQGLFDLARSGDRMVGIMPQRALAMGKTQQEFESAFMFFSRRFTRAGLSFMGDLFKGGLAGHEARAALGNMAAVGLVGYYGFCKALGVEPNFDPRSGKWMTIPIGGRNIGLGGIQYALLRLAGNTAGAITDAAQGEKPWTSIISLNRWDNPFIRFIRSRSAPLTGAIWEVMEGENFFGEPFETPWDWAKFVGGKTLPIWIQAVAIEREGITPAAMSVEIGGGRTFPMSPWQKAGNLRDQYAQADLGRSWDDLDKLEQRQVEQAHTDLQDMIKRAEEEGARFGTPAQQSVGQYLREMERARGQVSQGYWELQARYDAGRISGRQFREEVSDLQRGLGLIYQYNSSNPLYLEAVDRLARSGDQPTKTFDVAYNEYIATIIAAPDLENEWGEFNYEEYYNRIEGFKQFWGEGIWQDVQLMLALGRDEPPLMKELRVAKEVMRPYWQIRTQIIRQYGLEEIDQQITMMENIDPERARLMREYYGINKINQYVQKYRQYLRQSDPEIYKAWVMFYA